MASGVSVSVGRWLRAERRSPRAPRGGPGSPPGSGPSGATSSPSSSVGTGLTSSRSVSGSPGCSSLLAIFSDVGPVGRGVDTAFAALLGRGKVLVPIGLLVGAGSMLAPRVMDEDDEDVSSRRGMRLALGLALVSATVVGLLYLDRTEAPVDGARAASSAPQSVRHFGAGSGPPARSSSSWPRAWSARCSWSVPGSTRSRMRAQSAPDSWAVTCAPCSRCRRTSRTTRRDGNLDGDDSVDGDGGAGSPDALRPVPRRVDDRPRPRCRRGGRRRRRGARRGRRVRGRRRRGRVRRGRVRGVRRGGVRGRTRSTRTTTRSSKKKKSTSRPCRRSRGSSRRCRC